MQFLFAAKLTTALFTLAFLQTPAEPEKQAQVAPGDGDNGTMVGEGYELSGGTEDTIADDLRGGGYEISGMFATSTDNHGSFSDGINPVDGADD